MLLLLNCSPRQDGYIGKLLQEIIRGIQASKIDTNVELLNVCNMQVNPCQECGYCDDGQGCSQNDDMALILQKMDEADAIVFGSPVYYYGVSAQSKTVIDRCLARSKDSATKFGAMVVTAKSMGMSSVIKDLLMFFAVQGWIPVDAIASYVPFAQDGASMQRAFLLGKELAEIIHKKYRLPGLRMTCYAFGTHTK